MSIGTTLTDAELKLIKLILDNLLLGRDLRVVARSPVFLGLKRKIDARVVLEAEKKKRDSYKVTKPD